MSALKSHRISRVPGELASSFWGSVVPVWRCRSKMYLLTSDPPWSFPYPLHQEQVVDLGAQQVKNFRFRASSGADRLGRWPSTVFAARS